MTLLTLDRESKLLLLNVAQQLEARCDPIAIGQELRKMVESALPAASPKTVEAIVDELQRLPCREHGDGAKCPRCVPLANYRREMGR